MSKTRSRQIDDLDMADSLLRGIASEDRVEEALLLLKRERRILDYERSNSERDRFAIDFTVYFRDGEVVEEMPLQVKSSFSGARKHFRDHSDIPCIVVEDRDEVTDIAWKLLVALSLEHPLVDELVEKIYMCLTYQR